MTLPVAGNPISFSQVDVELGYSATAQISMNDSAVRTLFGVASGAIGMSSGLGKSNTSVPGAPTGVSASATSSSAISVSFTAPTCTGHLTIDYYQAVCTGSGTHSATGSSPISVTGLCPSTSYTFKVRAHNSVGYGSYSSSTGTATTTAVTSSASYTSVGTYTWVAPAGVTAVSVVAVGPGNIPYYYNCGYSVLGAGGGGLGWYNNISVTPATGYTVHVTAPTSCYNSFNFNWTYFCSQTLVAGSCGGFGSSSYSGRYNGQGGGYGGANCSSCRTNQWGPGGAGAGGYSGQGGTSGSGSAGTNGTSGAGGAGGGGNGSGNRCYFSTSGKGGGGVGIFGQGCSGAGGGYGGSGGNNASGANGGSYGGGAGGGSPYSYGSPGGSAVRIVYPGTTRQFPSTNVGSP